MRIGYACKYVPVEALESMGARMVRIEPDEKLTSFDAAEARMHANICSFAKAAFETVVASDLDGVVLTTCCDSMRRLADALAAEMPEGFVRTLDVPRTTTPAACALFERRVRELLDSYGKTSGQPFSEEKLFAELGGTACPADGACDVAKASALDGAPNETHSADGAPNAPDTPEEDPVERMVRDEVSLSPALLNVGIAGARANRTIKRILEDHGANIAFDITCTNARRRFMPRKRDTFSRYAHDVLAQIPCARMEDIALREEFLQRVAPEIDGIVYHTVQFCDMYSYEYSQLKRGSALPLLAIETDCTASSQGQILTRLEAFLESIGATKQAPRTESVALNGTVPTPNPPSPKGTLMSKPASSAHAGARYFAGIDSGSTSTNAVVIDDKGNIAASVVVRTGAKAGESAERAYREVIERAGLTKADIARTVSTGYGRVSIPFADENVTEISCHGRGAHYFNPAVRTILDIGGQDSKAIHVNAAGEVTDFAMNDKCAAGTGRFLEMIARSLEMSLDELGPAALASKKRLEITSMCSVFAESEVISLIANNEEKSDIAAGVCRAVAGKSHSLMRRVGLEGAFMMTGGVAKNPGVVHAVEELIGEKLYICPEPEIVGATGAALLAREQSGQ